MKKSYNSFLNKLGALSILLIIVVLSACDGVDKIENQNIKNEASQELSQQPELITETKNIPPSPPSAETKIWLPILVYHRIDIAEEWRDSVYKSLTIAPEWLDKQLAYLKENGFETIGYSDVVSYFENGTPLPPRPVMIDFDDGYKDNYFNALPLLKKYNYKATFFITHNLTGHKVYMTKEQVAELVAAGMYIGNHTLWHPNLVKSSDEKLRAEIGDAKKKLEETYGVKIEAFAYPFGKYDERVIRIVKETGHKIARSFSAGKGPVIGKENFFNVPVVSIWGNLPMSTWDKDLFPKKDKSATYVPYVAQ